MRSLCISCSILLLFSCVQEQKTPSAAEGKKIGFEKISYYKSAGDSVAELPYKHKVTYYHLNGKPYRWIDLDSTGSILTDYIYQYDTTWTQTGAKYIEPGEEDYAIERNRFEDEHTLITEWLDKEGNVFYTMIDALNAEGKTLAATFIGDTIHGRDSTFYTDEGFVQRIFFTNNKGKILNDRSFDYDSIADPDNWVRRKKIMGDTIQEIHIRSWLESGANSSGKYYPGIISSGEADENSVSLTADGKYAFFTRTNDWTHQAGYLAERKHGQWQTPQLMSELDTIYNGAISPDGTKIIYCTNVGDLNPAWLVEKKDGQWQEPASLGISAGYFHWVSDTEIAYYVHDNKGDLASASLIGTRLNPNSDLAFFNTPDTEFSPYLDPDKRFVLFTRYVIGDKNQQGIFISRNTGTVSDIQWETPVKLNIPYGWGAFVVGNLEALLYSDGQDIYQIPWNELDIP
ncbi:MAG: PD40 domain-containing protein, partial [Bacteroidia bacterium]|nr:PD40 domain-containing protein [Bacteroidia bacterium]